MLTATEQKSDHAKIACVPKIYLAYDISLRLLISRIYFRLRLRGFCISLYPGQSWSWITTG